VAGVDVVGSGGRPPGGGGGPTITATQAREAAWTYSKRACVADRRCRQYWAGSCVAQGTSAYGCEVRNYLRQGRRRATCKQAVTVTATGGAPGVAPAGNWSCRRGWHRGLAARLAG
jgi:hypothetical protein